MVDLSTFGQAVADHRQAAARAWEMTFNGVTYRETEAAVNAVENKGYKVSAARDLLEAGEALYQAGEYEELAGMIAQIKTALHEAPLRDRPDYVLPNSLEAIVEDCPGYQAGATGPPLDDAQYEDRVLGGWLGKVIGGALGEPLEGWTYRQIAERYPDLSAYLDTPPNTANDDPAFQVLLLHAAETYGPAFTSQQLAHEWVVHVPLEFAFTAERIALDNLRRGYTPPASAQVDNPFSEWVGGQMKGEICGWLAPARPDVALDLAYRDAIIAHTGNGILGELFTAALTSAALTDGATLDSALETAEAHLPPRSQYAQVVRQVQQWCHAHNDWRDAWTLAEKRYAARYHWVHTFPNIAAVLIGLHYGGGDFERSLLITTRCGLDTDTNAAQVGALLGTLHGAQAIPEKWRAPIGEWLELPLIGFERLRIADLARRTCAIGRQILQTKSP